MAQESDKLSPMLKQYLDIKQKYSDYILFFRLGDFYEMFFEDAENVSRELELALTSRAGSPMCGVPYHSCEIYIKKLIDKGFKVAICEQLTDPAASKGLVERDVIRLVTAGTVIESSMLSEDSNNYIACICPDEERKSAALVFADISTGEVHVFSKNGKDIEQDIISELSRFSPVEILINQAFLDLKEVHAFVRDRLKRCLCEMLDESSFDGSDMSVITDQFENGAELGISEMPLVRQALCAMFRYFGETQKATVKRFVSLTVHADGEFMGLNLTTRRNLELTETMRTKEKRGSLLWVLDKTVTSMGRRKLKTWLEQPLINPAEILKRHDAVEALTKDSALLYDICDALNGIYDLERLMTRIMYKSASPKDIYALGQTCARLPGLKQCISRVDSALFRKLNSEIDELNDVSSLVENAIVDDPPLTLKDGGVIKDGFNEEIDRLRKITGGGKDILTEIEERERAATGIRTLKVGYNRVFGYYIEVSKSNADAVPEDYIRKQTLANAERYTTPRLKELEDTILNAEDKLQTLEYDVFCRIRDTIAQELVRIQNTAKALAKLDVYASLSLVSERNHYVRPKLNEKGVIDIKDGRHPVVEQMITNDMFIANDTYLDNGSHCISIITGPNMAGKSTYMRQTALIVLMAQIGCFVPARSANIGIVDRIFTRVGASDDLASGQSTFMVEMNEVANILRNATSKSLLILDEIGRGTSTFDGLSIAWAVIEHISNRKLLGAKTLFATHYHELTELEGKMNNVNNYCIAVKECGDDIVFLRKIVKGGADKSYGIQVAKLAGVPDMVIDRAKEIVEQLSDNDITEKVQSIAIDNKNEGKTKKQPKYDEVDLAQMSLFDTVTDEDILKELMEIEVTTLTPLDALNTLYRLQNKLKNRWNG